MGSLNKFATREMKTLWQTRHLVVCEAPDDRVYCVQLFAHLEDAEACVKTLNRLPARMRYALGEAASEMKPDEILEIALKADLP